MTMPGGRFLCPDVPAVKMVWDSKAFPYGFISLQAIHTDISSLEVSASVILATSEPLMQVSYRISTGALELKT